MKKTRHRETEIVKALRQLDSGQSARSVAREYGISTTTLYKWRSKYGGMSVSQIKRLKKQNPKKENEKEHEKEHEREMMKQLYAELAALDKKNRLLPSAAPAYKAATPSSARPDTYDPDQPTHWYKVREIWYLIAWALFMILLFVISMASDKAEEKAAKVKPRSYEEIFTPEEAKRMGIGGHIDGPGDWKPDPNAARNIREFLQKGGNADPAIDALQNSDFYDVIDQLGGEEGF